MLLSYVCNILKFKKWELFSIFLIFLLLKRSPFTSVLQRNVYSLTETEKCPACFGISACGRLNHLRVRLDDFRSIFFYFFAVKNVYYASLSGNEVVVKKLAQNIEWEQFDSLASNKVSLGNIVATKEAEELINAGVKESKLHYCGSIESIGELLKNVYGNNVDVDRETLDINIHTAWIINPEPLVLQILPANQSWPVPQYLGSCGRIIVEEYVGPPLTAFYHESWLRRAKIAISLLDAARKFTFEHERFSFYLTDVSADNVAIDSTDNAKFVDLENVVVVDRSDARLEQRLQVNTEDFSCAECLAFSVDDICKHKHSDHNYYAVCKTLLAANVDNKLLPDGFLHSIPSQISAKHPNLLYLIKQCAKPENSQRLDRIQAGDELKELLETIIKHPVNQ